MAYQCGSGVNVFQNKTGVYNIRYTVPKSGYLEYQYPGENPQRIEGNDLTYTAKTEGLDCSRQYAVTVAYTFKRCYQGIVVAQSSGVVINNNNATAIAGKILGLELVRVSGYTSLRLKIEKCNGTIGIANVYGTTRGLSSNCLTDRTDSPVANAIDAAASTYSLIDIVPRAYPSECTFRVFEGQVEIFNRTSTVCPAVNQVNCVPGEESGEFTITNYSAAKALDIVQSISNSVRSVDVKLGGTIIKKISSPTNCNLYPEVCYSWEAEECPSGTCECTRGSLVCCYDSSGKCVKSFIRG